MNPPKALLGLRWVVGRLFSVLSSMARLCGCERLLWLVIVGRVMGVCRV
jgi:hypothetical protein